jgi:hypothetical protein
MGLLERFSREKLGIIRDFRTRRHAPRPRRRDEAAAARGML